MEKIESLYNVSVDITLTKNITLSATSEEHARQLVMEMFEKSAYSMIQNATFLKVETTDIIKENRYINVDGNGYVTLELYEDMISYCSHSGKCDEDCEIVLKIPFVKDQFKRIPDERLNKSLYECLDKTMEEIETMTRHDREMYALWIAANNAVEQLQQ